MLAAAGVRIARDGDRVTVAAQDELELGALHVPGDPSSAAFLAAAAVLVPRSRIVIEGMGANWTRTGFFRILRRMGGVVVGPLEEPCERRADRGAGVRARRLPRPAGRHRGRARGGPAGDRRAAARGAARLLRRGRDRGARGGRAAAEGERPDRHRRRRAERARREHRGDRRRLRRAGHGRPARRRARGPRRPPAGDAGRRRRRWPRARASRSSGWRRPRSPTRASRPISPRCADGPVPLPSRRVPGSHAVGDAGLRTAPGRRRPPPPAAARPASWSWARAPGRVLAACWPGTPARR